jgi:hypothetical protein
MSGRRARYTSEIERGFVLRGWTGFSQEDLRASEY